MIHYIYKITFLRGYPTGRYYLGKRSYKGTDLNKDLYTGSGNFCKSYFKKYGIKLGDTYIKEIIEINPSSVINAQREIIIIGDLWKTDPLCMNMCPGGDNGFAYMNTKEIDQYDLNGRFIKTWSSAENISQELNIDHTSILEVCRGYSTVRHTVGGFFWTYHNKPLNIKKKKKKYIWKRKVLKYDKNGNLLETYNSLHEASETANCSWQSIQRCCNYKRPSAGGFIWRFAN